MKRSPGSQRGDIQNPVRRENGGQEIRSHATSSILESPHAGQCVLPCSFVVGSALFDNPARPRYFCAQEDQPMQTPAVWRDDPACGHGVAHAYQTHYCSYTRTPRLLTLQRAADDDELALIAACQWYELWFKVLRLDLAAALASDGQTYEPVKLLKRGLELFRLFEQHADLIETILVRELRITRALRGLEPMPSAQFREILRLAEALPRLAALAFPGLTDAVAEYAVRLQAFRVRYERFISATLLRAEAGPDYAGWLALETLLELQEGVKGGWCAAGDAPQEFWLPDAGSPDGKMF